MRFSKSPPKDPQVIVEPPQQGIQRARAGRARTSPPSLTKVVLVKRLSEEASRPGALGEKLKKRRKEGPTPKAFPQVEMGGAGAVAGGDSGKTSDPVVQAALHKEDGNGKLKVHLDPNRCLSRPRLPYPGQKPKADCAHAAQAVRFLLLDCRSGSVLHTPGLGCTARSRTESEVGLCQHRPAAPPSRLCSACRRLATLRKLSGSTRWRSSWTRAWRPT